MKTSGKIVRTKISFLQLTPFKTLFILFLHNTYDSFDP